MEKQNQKKSAQMKSSASFFGGKQGGGGSFFGAQQSSQFFGGGAIQRKAVAQRKVGIIASVGAGGKNLKSDVKTIQNLLSGSGYPLVADGLIGPKTIAAIKQFQKEKLGYRNPDGRVDVGGKTFRKLSSSSQSSSTPTNENTSDGGGSSSASDGGSSGSNISGSVGAGGKNSKADGKVVQQMLNANGYSLTVDGIVGAKTIAAIKDFQYTRFGWSKPDGKVDPGGTTWNGLTSQKPAKYKPKPKQETVSEGDPNAPTDKPNWLSIAEGELGVKENTSKSKHNPRVVEYHSTTGGWKEDETPWCASFVNWVMQKSGHGGNGSAWAQSWANYGKKVSKPCYGAIAVFKWSSRTGHVGFIVGKSGSKIRVLGGNQNNEVNISNYGTSQVLAYVVPSGFNVPSSFFNLAEGQGVDGSVANTR